MKDIFVYSENPLIEKDAFAAHVDLGCASLDDFFHELASSLKFPYWGYNWDSFDENINVLDWINEKKIYIVHQNKWTLGDVDFTIYIRLLREAAVSWRRSGEHTLAAVFPAAYRAVIEKLLS